jgi:hypothetical protein
MRMWAYYDRIKGTYHHVYRNENLVRMCSPDGFKEREARGEGEVVQVEISHLISVAPDKSCRCEEPANIETTSGDYCLKCRMPIRR